MITSSGRSVRKQEGGVNHYGVEPSPFQSGRTPSPRSTPGARRPSPSRTSPETCKEMKKLQFTRPPVSSSRSSGGAIAASEPKSKHVLYRAPHEIAAARRAQAAPKSAKSRSSNLGSSLPVFSPSHHYRADSVRGPRQVSDAVCQTDAGQTYVNSELGNPSQMVGASNADVGYMMDKLRIDGRLHGHSWAHTTVHAPSGHTQHQSTQPTLSTTQVGVAVSQVCGVHGPSYHTAQGCVHCAPSQYVNQLRTSGSSVDNLEEEYVMVGSPLDAYEHSRHIDAGKMQQSRAASAGAHPGARRSHLTHALSRSMGAQHQSQTGVPMGASKPPVNPATRCDHCRGSVVAGEPLRHLAASQQMVNVVVPAGNFQQAPNGATSHVVASGGRCVLPCMQCGRGVVVVSEEGVITEEGNLSTSPAKNGSGDFMITPPDSAKAPSLVPALEMWKVHRSMEGAEHFASIISPVSQSSRSHDGAYSLQVSPRSAFSASTPRSSRSSRTQTPRSARSASAAHPYAFPTHPATHYSLVGRACE
eukprot:Rmarinus@m.24943